MDTRFAITEYPDAAAITAQLDALIKKPIYSINRAALKRYEEEYFEKKCAKSKEMITEAKNVIPGGVQHNLAFNYPFPIVMTKAKGNRLYDIDGNEYFDFLQAGGPTIIGSNDDVVKEKVKELLDECGPSPVCSILMNTSLLRRLVNASHQLKCSVCLVQVLNLVCVLFV